MNDSRRKDISEFTSVLRHQSNASARQIESLRGKNTPTLEMMERALVQGIEADYLPVDSLYPKGTSGWAYAKPNFIHQSNTLDMQIITRLANNEHTWNFKGKDKTLNAMYSAVKNVRHKSHGKS